MLQWLATIGNILLCVSLCWQRGWRTWPWVFWAQMVSMILMLIQGRQQSTNPEAFKHWWQTFDVANIIVEGVYLRDFYRRRANLPFSVFAALGLYTCSEYFVYEGLGLKVLANQMLAVRQWVDALAMFMLAYVVYATSQEEHSHARRAEAPRPTPRP